MRLVEVWVSSIVVRVPCTLRLASVWFPLVGFPLDSRYQGVTRRQINSLRLSLSDLGKKSSLIMDSYICLYFLWEHQSKSVNDDNRRPLSLQGFNNYWTLFISG